MRMDLLMEWSRPTRLLALVCKRMTFVLRACQRALMASIIPIAFKVAALRVALARSMAALRLASLASCNLGPAIFWVRTPNVITSKPPATATQPRAGWRMKIRIK